MSVTASTRGGAFPFFKGAATSEEVMQKTHKIIYGKRVLQQHRPENEAVEKPQVQTLLINSPNNKIESIIRHANLANEIDGMTISNVLKQLRKFNRYDKGLQICRSYEKEVGRRLKASHFVSLMTLALQSPEKLEDGGTAPGGGWREALRLFNSGFVARKKENPLTSASIGAAFAALGAGGKWEQSAELFHSVVQDRIPLEPRAVHSLLSQLRRQNKWDLALRAFDTAVQKSQTQPDYLMYRELLYTINDSAKLSPQNAASAWRYALSVASAIDHVCPPNAGTYNILIETCGISTSTPSKNVLYDPKTKKYYRVGEDGKPLRSMNDSHTKLVDTHNHWEAGIRVFQHLQDRVILSAVTEGSSRTIVNSQTIEALSKLRQKNPEFQIKCIELARKHGLVVPESVFRRLFISLDLTERSEEGLAFAQKFLDDSINDTGNLGSALEPMLLGLLDSLSLHPESEIATITADHFQSSLQPVVASSTVGCGVWGDESQSWIVESGARVAVIDATVLKQAAVTDLHMTLLSQFDAIMVPFTAVRAVLKSLHEEPNQSPQGEKYLRALNLLRTLQLLEAPLKAAGESQERAGTGPVQVLPFVHHLKALSYLKSENFIGKTDSFLQDDDGNDHQEGEKLKLDPSLFEEVDDEQQQQHVNNRFEGTKFLSAAASSPLKIVSTKEQQEQRQEDIKSIVNGKTKVEAQSSSSSSSSDSLVPFWDLNEVTKFEKHKSQGSDHLPGMKRAKHFLSPSVYGWSHPVATALMLSRLNPDAKITVVHHSSFVEKCAEFYNVEHRDYFELYTNFREERSSKKKMLSSPRDEQKTLLNADDVENDDAEDDEQAQEDDDNNIESESQSTRNELKKIYGALQPERKSLDKKKTIQEVKIETDRSKSVVSPFKGMAAKNLKNEAQNTKLKKKSA